MRYTPTAVEGVTIVDLEHRADDRGFFARTFDADEFDAAFDELFTGNKLP